MLQPGGAALLQEGRQEVHEGEAILQAAPVVVGERVHEQAEGGRLPRGQGVQLTRMRL